MHTLVVLFHCAVSTVVFADVRDSISPETLVGDISTDGYVRSAPWGDALSERQLCKHSDRHTHSFSVLLCNYVRHLVTPITSLVTPFLTL